MVLGRGVALGQARGVLLGLGAGRGAGAGPEAEAVQRPWPGLPICGPRLRCVTDKASLPRF